MWDYTDTDLVAGAGRCRKTPSSRAVLCILYIEVEGY